LKKKPPLPLNDQAGEFQGEFFQIILKNCLRAPETLFCSFKKTHLLSKKLTFCQIWLTFWQKKLTFWQKNSPFVKSLTFWQIKLTFWQKNSPFVKSTHLLTKKLTFWQKNSPFDKFDLSNVIIIKLDVNKHKIWADQKYQISTWNKGESIWQKVSQIWQKVSFFVKRWVKFDKRWVFLSKGEFHYFMFSLDYISN